METQALSIANAQSKSFKKLMRLLIWKFQPLQIFCFAKSNLLKEDSSCFSTKKIIADSSYCLLMVTESDLPAEQAVQKFINSRFTAGRISILCYSKKAASLAITARNRFLLTVYSSSQLLYSKDQLLQADYKSELNPLTVLKKAEKKSTHSHSLIDSFFAGATHSFNQQQYPMCVLMLYKVTEQCLILLLSVHLSFRMEGHSLSTLIGLCRSFSDQPEHLLLAGEENKRLLEILIRSNFEVYKCPDFSVSEHDARQLFIRISAFMKLTRLLCKDKIDQLEQETAALIPVIFLDDACHR